MMQCGCGSYRYIILVITGLLLSFILSSVIAFNSCFTSIQNIETSPLHESFENGIEDSPDWSSLDLPMADRRFVFTPIQKSVSFAATFGGAVLGVQPFSFIIHRFGVHRSMSVTGLIGAFAVAFTPFAISWSFPLFAVIRLINGFTFSMLFTVAGTVCTKWAPLKERGIFVAVLTGHVEIAALFTMPIGAAIASSAGWPITFFVHGAILAGITVLFALLFRDDPCTHPFVSPLEVGKIIEGKATNASNAVVKTPYRAIFSSPVVWASWIATIGTFFVAQFTITWAPVYLNRILKYQPTVTGVITVIPLVCQLVIKLLTGFLSDKLTCFNEVMKLRFFNTIALVGAAFFFCIVTIIPPSDSVIDVVLTMAPIAFLGFHSGGFPKCLIMVSQQYSSFVMSIVQMVACSTMLAGSFVVPLLTPGDTFDEWRKVFIIYAVVLVFSNTVFVIFASAKPAKWTSSNKIYPTESSSSSQLDVPVIERV